MLNTVYYTDILGDGEMQELEMCFQRGILKCTDVPGQKCPVHPDCQAGWGCEHSSAW